MTLQIKVAGGRESVMVHLGRKDSRSRTIRRSIPTEINFESPGRSAGKSRKDAIVDRRRLYRIAHHDHRHFSPQLSDRALALGGIDGTRCEVDATGDFHDVRVAVGC